MSDEVRKPDNYSDLMKGIRKGKNANLLTNLEIPEDYHGSKDLNSPMPDAKGDGND